MSVLLIIGAVVEFWPYPNYEDLRDLSGTIVQIKKIDRERSWKITIKENSNSITVILPIRKSTNLGNLISVGEQLNLKVQRGWGGLGAIQAYEISNPSSVVVPYGKPQTSIPSYFWWAIAASFILMLYGCYGVLNKRES